MSDIAIKCEALSKRYRIGEQERYKALRDVIADTAAAPFRRLRAALDRRPETGDGNGRDSFSVGRPSSVAGHSSNSGPRSSVLGQPSADGLFWALDDVSFEVKRGEVVGIIGRNGAGKSTLLKILSRITKPTKGHAEIHGRVGSLLEVGTGFHPELTGRENIYLNGAILGMRKAEIDRKFDEIVAFAEVEKFIDTPVKRYSSGMYVRLAFAVAAHMETEILLVDEVLAVGDAQFQKKCLGKIGDVAKCGRTVLFVSHNMTAIKSLCDRAMELNEGQVRGWGDTAATIANYLQGSREALLRREWQRSEAPGNENGKVLYAAVKNIEDSVELTVETPIDLSFGVLHIKADKLMHLNAILYNQENVCLFTSASKPQTFSAGLLEAQCQVPPYLLNDGSYSVRLIVHYENSDSIDLENVLRFDVHDGAREDWHWYEKWPGIVRPRLDWTFKSI
ncbi:MAG TPA: polysaccharide ABC transporter ATP-binding protein [Pyrinomonadaceae bacterium]|nr:polysaccharide ABC transporter ATP-binding protein [Pyrinomonadaceae bacterium]